MVKKRRTKRPVRQKPAGIGGQEPASSTNPENRLSTFFASVERRVTGQEPTEPAQSAQELTDRLNQYSASKRLAWLQRPRLHTAIFSEVWRDDQIAKLGGKLVGEKAQKEAAERRQEILAIAKKLSWSEERLIMFMQVVVEYRQKSTTENYLRLRRQFPELEIQVAEFGGMDPLYALEKEFRAQGISPELIELCLDADEPSIDALSLHLIEKIIERDKISKNEPGHIQKRRAAISDAMINYLIVTILESFDWVEHEARIPASLVVLIRHQLTGPKPDLHTAVLAKEWLKNTAIRVAQILTPNEKLSINKLASIANVPRSRAARLLKDKEFQEWLTSAQKWKKEGLFSHLHNLHKRVSH